MDCCLSPFYFTYLSRVSMTIQLFLGRHLFLLDLALPVDRLFLSLFYIYVKLLSILESKYLYSRIYSRLSPSTSTFLFAFLLSVIVHTFLVFTKLIFKFFSFCVFSCLLSYILHDNYRELLIQYSWLFCFEFFWFLLVRPYVLLYFTDNVTDSSNSSLSSISPKCFKISTLDSMV